MANWREVWNREKQIINNGGKLNTIEAVYKEMRRVNGYDAVDGEYSWEDFLAQWKEWNHNLNFSKRDYGGIESVFEVGCGSGPNLLLYQSLCNHMKVGGIDYSEPLTNIANQYIDSEELYCGEAIEMDTKIKYDAVISYSVFHYFSDYGYAERVLEKMYQKALHVIAILDIHDLKKKESFLNNRRALTPDYDIKYRGLDKLFFDKQFFIDFAEKYHCDIKIDHSNVKSYWNNNFVYHCYLYKQER